MKLRVAVVTMLLSAVVFGGLAVSPSQAEDLGSEALAPGVDHHIRRVDDRISLHILHVKPEAAVRLVPVLSSDRISTGRETTSSMCARNSAIACVNASFGFCPQCDGFHGGVVREETLLRNPTGDVENVSIINGALTSESWPWSVTLQAQDGEQLAIDAVNRARPEGGISLYTHFFGPTTGTEAGGVEYTFTIAGQLWVNQGHQVRPVSGVHGGDSPLPEWGFVVSGDGPGADALRRFVRIAQDDDAPPRLVAAVPGGLQQSVGGYPVLLRKGRVQPLPSGGFADRHPRTAIGWDPNGAIWLVVVDGRQPGYSDGMTLSELAGYLRALGATEAVNLDGGGSSTLAARCGDSYCAKNRPSDSGGERRVWTALALLATDG